MSNPSGAWRDATGVAGLMAGLTLTTALHAGIGEPFEADGVITDNCFSLLTDSGGEFHLSDTGEFSVGDEVRVIGELGPIAFQCFASSEFQIHVTVTSIQRIVATCGTLVTGNLGQPLFASDDGEVFQIDDLSGFGIGDSLFVRGLVLPVIDGPALEPLILTDLVGECFSANGRLAHSGGCTFFHDDAGNDFLLERLSLFEEDGASGQFVHVEGVLDESCVSFCGLPCIQGNAIEARLGGCGQIVEDFKHGLILIGEGPHRADVFTLDDLGGFGIGDRVFVVGDYTDGPPTLFDLDPSPVVVEFIGSCFADLGQIVDTDPAMVQITSLDPDEPGPTYRLDFAVGSSVGDKVWVTGSLDDTAEGTPTIVSNTIQSGYENCGELGLTFECGFAIVDDLGAIYSLENFGEFSPGDQVWIKGGIADLDFAFCRFVNGIIQYNEIALCNSCKGPLSPADFDNNCAVDPADLASLLGAWGPCRGACPWDLDGDGNVGPADLAQLLGGWGEQIGTIAP